MFDLRIFVYFCCQINCVVMRGLNTDELVDFVSLTEHKVSYDSHMIVM